MHPVSDGRDNGVEIQDVMWKGGVKSLISMTFVRHNSDVGRTILGVVSELCRRCVGEEAEVIRRCGRGVWRKVVHDLIVVYPCPGLRWWRTGGGEAVNSC